MVEFDIAENVQLSRKRQILASICANIGTICFGVVMGYTAFAFPKMELSDQFKTVSTLEEKTWIASIAALGVLLSNSVTEICQEKLGRRKTILSMAIPLNLAWTIMFCSSNAVFMCIGRFITGFTAGSFLTTVPLYVKEVSHESIHKNLESMHYCMIPFGILVSYISGYFLDWLWLTISCSLTPLLLICVMIYMPESPYFLVKQGKLEKAKKSLQWLTMSDDCYEVKLIIEEMQRKIEETNSKKQNTPWKYFITLNKIKDTLACLLFHLVQQFNLMNVIIFFSVDMCKEFSIFNTESSPIPILMIFTLFLSILLSSLFHNFPANAKIILCVSTAVSSISLGILGTLWFFKDAFDLSLFMYTYFAILMLYITFYGMGLAYLPYSFSKKCLPGFNSGLTFICTWAAAFAILNTYHDLDNILGSGILHLALAIFGISSLPFSYFLPITNDMN